MDLTAALRAFIRTIERGSITAAARDLGVSQPAVSQLLRRLEAHVGARLLERNARALRLTPQGVVLYEAGGVSLSAIDSAMDEIRQNMDDIRGTLRVHAPVCLGVSHLHRILTQFQDRYPAVSVELTLENRTVDLVHENIDVAIRIGRPVEQNHILRRIGYVRRILVAAPEYLAKHGPINRSSALSKHSLVVTNTAVSRRGTLGLLKGAKSVEVPVQPVLTTNNAQVLIDALCAGRGVGPVQLLLVTEHLRSGSLVRVLPQYEVRRGELYVTYPTARYLRPAVRAWINYASPALQSIEGISA